MPSELAVGTGGLGWLVLGGRSLVEGLSCGGMGTTVFAITDLLLSRDDETSISDRSLFLRHDLFSACAWDVFASSIQTRSAGRACDGMKDTRQKPRRGDFCTTCKKVNLMNFSSYSECSGKEEGATHARNVKVYVQRLSARILS